MDTTIAPTTIKTINALVSPTTARMTSASNLLQTTSSSTRLDTLALTAKKSSNAGFLIQQRVPKSVPRLNGSLFLTRSSMRPGIDSDNATSRNPAIELNPDSTTQPQSDPTPNRALPSKWCKGLVLDMGPECSWDGAEVGSPVVKRFIGDDEERWYMWYHGRSDEGNTSGSIGLAVSRNGIHWARGAGTVRSSGDVGMVMEHSSNWWAFDTESIQPSEMVIMSSPMYSAVYWLYYSGSTQEEVVLPPDLPIGQIYKSIPGLACSQDGRNWARIEGDHHSGGLLEPGSKGEWDSLFIDAPRVVMHSDDDLRMYYHSYDVENRQFAIGLARSRDGIRWVKLGKVMGGGRKGSFDELGAMNAHVIRNKKDGKYLMAYEGLSAEGTRSIGLAVSEDGLKNWARIQDDPVLVPSEEDGWDNKGVGSPCLVQMEGESDELRLYYRGSGQEERTGIGMAITDGNNTGRFRRWEGLYL